MELHASVLAVGDELVQGLSLDTNGPFAARRLVKAGFRLGQIRSVGDDEDKIAQALLELSGPSRVVVVSGGLGPTPDDVTASAAARAADVGLRVDQASVELLEARLAAFGRTLTEEFKKQVRVPETAQVLTNPVGTAPGFALEIGSAVCFFLPGVPVEFRGMFENLVEPRLLESFPEIEPVPGREFRICALGESMLQARVHAIVSRPETRVHYLPHLAGVDLVVEWTGRASDRQAGLLDVERRLTESLGWKMYDTSGADLAEVVGRALGRSGGTLSAAESCTGGLLGHKITEVPGSSRYFSLGVVVYSNEAKMRVLGLAPGLLEEHGAVSEPVVRAMAEAVRELGRSALGVGISGIAGPDGGTPEKPVGTVHLALAADRGTVHLMRRLPGTRSQIKERAAYAALALLHRHLKDGWLGR